jgi:hypothetical protein
MAEKLYTEEYISDIADAIRRKNGKTVTYTVSEMAEAIDDITSYPEPTGTQQITENGIVSVKDKEFADVNVQATATLISKTITANGSYDAEDDEADGYSDVTVNVPNTYTASDEGKVVSNGELVAQTGTTVTQNGTYDTTENDEVVVNVSGGGSAVVQALSVTQNGTYTPPSGVDGYAPVTVNVSGGGGSESIDDDPAIPSDYQKVEYLDFDGASYFELPSKFKKGYLAEFYIEPLVLSGSQGFMGSVSSTGNRYELYFDGSSYHCFVSSMYIMSNVNDSVLTTSNGSLLSVSIGTKYYFSAFSYGNSSANNITIGRHSTEWYKSRVYKFRLSCAIFPHSNAQTLFFLIPCRRKSDNALGFYDSKNNIFYTNQGTGTLIAGPDVN